MAKASERDRNTPVAVEQCHDLLRWLIPHLDKFLRSRRFTLGERLERGLLDVLDDLIQAAYTRNKSATLQQANRKLSVVRHLWRLCFELKVIPTQRFETGAGHIDTLGRQIGGWLRHSSRA